MSIPSDADSRLQKSSDALRISMALDQNDNRNSLEYLRLLHDLSGTNPKAIIPILTGLTHFTVDLHSYPKHSPLHLLIRAALCIDMHAISPTEELSTLGLETFQNFLANLISANADYIDPIFNMIAKRVFTMSAAQDALLAAMHKIICHAIRTYPRSKHVLLSTLQKSYPHPVRPPVEHQAYARAILKLAKEESLAQSLLLTTIERVAAIEALVPRETIGTENGELCIEAERLELVLLEICNFFDNGGNFEPAFTAYQVFIVPLNTARFSPYFLIYAASLDSSNHMLHEAVERLWYSFHNPSTPMQLRERFLQHSTKIVMYATAYDSRWVRKWVLRLANWLNAYLDSSGGNSYSDPASHTTLTTAVSSLLHVLMKKPSTVTSTEFVNRMRLYRIISATSGSLKALPSLLVTSFFDLMRNNYDIDYKAMLSESSVWSYSTQSECASSYIYFHSDLFTNTMFPKLKAKLDNHVLWD